MTKIQSISSNYCGGKIEYPTYNAALKALRFTLKGKDGQKRPKSMRLVVYACRSCHRFHIGHAVIKT